MSSSVADAIAEAARRVHSPAGYAVVLAMTRQLCIKLRPAQHTQSRRQRSDHASKWRYWFMVGGRRPISAAMQQQLLRAGHAVKQQMSPGAYLAVVPCGPVLPLCTSCGGLRMSSQTWSTWRSSNLPRSSCLCHLRVLLLPPTLRLPGAPILPSCVSEQAGTVLLVRQSKNCCCCCHLSTAPSWLLITARCVPAGAPL